MEISKEQKLNSEIVQKAWEDAKFKRELIANPIATMEKLAGEKINLPEGQKLVVADQSDASTVYFNIPKKIEVDNLELTEEQLEQVAGGILPAIIYGVVIGISIWAATND